jgi:hypothetical protein
MLDTDQSRGALRLPEGLLTVPGCAVELERPVVGEAS